MSNDPLNILNDQQDYPKKHFGAHDVRTTLLGEIIQSFTSGTVFALTVKQNDVKGMEELDLTHLWVTGIENTSDTLYRGGGGDLQSVRFTARCIGGKYHGTRVQMNYCIHFRQIRNTVSLEIPATKRGVNFDV